MAHLLELGDNTPKVLSHDKKDELAEDFAKAMHLCTSAAKTLCLKTAIDLGLFDIISKGGEGAKLSPAEIASQMSATNPDAPSMLDRILRLLASCSVLSCSVVCDDDGSNIKRLYSLNPASKYLVTDEDGISLESFIALGYDKIDCWPQLKFSVLEGGLAFTRAHGMTPFEYAGIDQNFNKLFNLGLQSLTTIILKKILERYNGFQDVKQLVDVGGGLGLSLNKITSKYPHIKGINFDLPHVVENAPSYAGVEHVGGDMFDSVPHGDAILLKWVLHDWSDEKCLKLLKKCHKAIPDSGKVIVVDSILPVMFENSIAENNIFASDVYMMTQINLGGKERTQQEFLSLATDAGFSGMKLMCYVCVYWIMEFYK